MNVELKQCPGCLEFKNYSEFNRKDGRCVECRKLPYNKSLSRINREHSRHLKKKYGVNKEDFDAISISQNHRCFICGEYNISPKTGLRCQLAVDHKHTDGKLGHLLCDSCNLGLGFFKDNPTNLRRAAAYVRITR